LGGVKMRKLLALGLVLLVLVAVFIFIPFAVAYSIGHPERFEYYVKALEYGLLGLKEYFKFVLDLFKEAISVG
jgi:hypothetical protein